MDMRIDSGIVKTERQRRAWSQEHLAEVTGLGLRTIQRIENGGTASYESARALASVFSVDVEALTGSPKRRRSVGAATVGLAASVLVAAAVMVSTDGWAEQVLLDVDISQNDVQVAQGQLLVAEGKDGEIRVDDAVQVVIAPVIQDDGKVFLSAKIYEMVGGEFVLLSEPKLITADDKEAEIRVSGPTGNAFQVLITPHRSDEN